MSGKIINLTGKTIFVLEESGRINQIIPRDEMGKNEFLSRCLTTSFEYEDMGTVTGISVRRLKIKVGSPITNLNKRNIYIIPTYWANNIFTAFSYIDNIYVPENSIKTGKTTTKLSHKKIYGIDKCEEFMHNAGCKTGINDDCKRSKDKVTMCFGLIPLSQYVWSTFYGVDNLDACVLKTQPFMNTNYAHHYSGKAEIINTTQYDIPISSHNEDNNGVVTLPAYDTENSPSLIKSLYPNKTFPINKSIMGIPLYNRISAKKSFPEPKDGVIYVLDSRMPAYMTPADLSRTDILYVHEAYFVTPSAISVHSNKGSTKSNIDHIEANCLEARPVFVSDDNIDIGMLFSKSDKYQADVLEELTKRGLIEVDHNRNKIIIHHDYMGCDDLIIISKMYMKSVKTKSKYLEDMENSRVFDNILNKLGFADNHVVTGKDYYLKSYDSPCSALVSRFTINNTSMRDVINELIDEGHIIKTDDTLDTRKYHFINKQFIKDISKAYADKIDEAKDGDMFFNSHIILLDIFKTYEIDTIHNDEEADDNILVNPLFPYEPIRDDDTDEDID